MRELEVLDRGHLKLEWEERKAFFEEELDGHVRSEVKRLLEEALDAERTSRVAVGRYVRDVETRCDFRNGYYRRDLGTRLGLLRGLRIPRARRGYKSELLPRYQRRQESVHGLVREAFLDRKSTRLNSSHVRISYAVFCLKKKKHVILYSSPIVCVAA